MCKVELFLPRNAYSVPWLRPDKAAAGRTRPPKAVEDRRGSRRPGPPRPVKPDRGRSPASRGDPTEGLRPDKAAEGRGVGGRRY